jgi:hypothetical protein
MPQSLHAFRRSGGLAVLLTLLLLIPFVSVVSPVNAASSKASASPQGKPHVGTTIAPVRTSTLTAPHKVSGSPSSKPVHAAAVPSSQPAPSSGATVLRPPVQARGGIVPRTVVAAPSFPGQQGSLYGGQDPSADAGRYNVMEVAHESFTIYDRSGNLQYSDDLNAWFGVTRPFEIWTGDVIFDPWNEQFAFIATDNYNYIYIAVAQQMNALGSYCNYTFSLANFASTSSDSLITAQAVGYDETYLYYTANEYTDGHSMYSIVYQINLKQMESCSSVGDWEWDHLTDPSGQQAFGIVPAMKYNYNVAHDEEYLIDPILSGGCSMTLWRINNHVLYRNSVNTECYSTPPSAPQAGSSQAVPTTMFGQLFHQATYSNGLLDFALTTGYNWGNGNITAAIDWLKLDPVAATVSQQGIIASSIYWYFFPSMAQDMNGKTVMVFNVSSTFIYPSVWYLAQNADGSQQNTLALVWGTGVVPDLGEYQSARLDPVDAVHIWICGNYGRGATGWASQIAQTAAS